MAREGGGPNLRGACHLLDIQHVDINPGITVAPRSVIGLEQSLAPLELLANDSLNGAVVDYYRRVPSGPKSRPRWTPDQYPTGSEKELYAEFGCIVLFEPRVTVPALLRLFDTPVSETLVKGLPSGSWRAYRLSTRRLRGSGCGTPMGFPGVAGCGGIADVGLFLNPTFDGKGGSQMQAQRVLLFEIKSQDHHPHKESQLSAHLRAIERDDQSRSTFLGAVGGRRVHIQHPRWLGHVGLNDFLADMGRVVNSTLGNSTLAFEIELTRQRKVETPSRHRHRRAVLGTDPLTCVFPGARVA